MAEETGKLPEVSEAEMDEVRRRIRDYESGVDKGVDWEELNDELLKSP